MKLIERITRAEYEDEEKTLPKSCTFLTDIPFLAIRKCKNSRNNTVLRVEFTKKQARELAEKAVDYIRMQRENDRLEVENFFLKKRIIEAQADHEKMVQIVIDRNVEYLISKGVNPDKIAKSKTKFKDSSVRLAEAGTFLQSPPLQGGLPG